MEKLTGISRAAYIGCIVLAITWAIAFIVMMNADDPVRDAFVLIIDFSILVRCMLLLLLFMALAISSGSTSPLKKPLWLIAVGIMTGLLTQSFSAVFQIMMMAGDSCKVPLGLSGFLELVGEILFCAGMIRFSRSFEKGSTLRRTGIMLAVVPLGSFVVEAFANVSVFSLIDDHAGAVNAINLIHLVLESVIWLCIILFLRSFSGCCRWPCRSLVLPKCR